MMTVQDPPMCFAKSADEDDTDFDTSMYKCYVNEGATLAYTVWPCLLLYKDGPVVARGVAEGNEAELDESTQL